MQFKFRNTTWWRLGDLEATYEQKTRNSAVINSRVSRLLYVASRSPSRHHVVFLNLDRSASHLTPTSVTVFALYHF